MNEGRRCRRQRPQTALAPGKRSAQARIAEPGRRCQGWKPAGRDAARRLDAKHESPTLSHAMRQGDTRCR